MTDGYGMPLCVLPMSLIASAPSSIPRLIQSCSSIPSNFSPSLGIVPHGFSHWLVANPAVRSLSKRLVGFSLSLAWPEVLHYLPFSLFEAKFVGVRDFVSLDICHTPLFDLSVVSAPFPFFSPPFEVTSFSLFPRFFLSFSWPVPSNDAWGNNLES